MIALAAGLRAWALDHGLPFPIDRPDELTALEKTAGFPAGDLNPHWFVYPNFYFYLLWIWQEGVLGLRRLFAPTPDYRTLLESGVPTLLLQGRLLAAGLGTLTVAAVYAVGRRLGGHALGLLAALLLAVNLLHLRDSQNIKAEVFLTAGVLLSFVCLAHYAHRPGFARALAAGAAIGLTTSLKYTGILLLAPAWLAGVLASPRRGWRRLLPQPAPALLAATSVVVFLASSPYLVLDWELTRDTLSYASSNTFIDHSAAARAPAAGGLERLQRLFAERSFGYHPAVSLRYGAGLAFALFTPFALLLALRRPRDGPAPEPFFVLAASFVLFYYLVIGASPVSLARYVTPVTPLLALLVAHGVIRLRAWAVQRGLPGGAVVCALGFVLAAEPTWRAVAHDRIAARTDTRVLASEWMAQQLPPGSVVAPLGKTYFAPYGEPELPAGIARAKLKLGETELDAHGVTHVLTHEHPLRFSTQNRSQLAVLEARLELLADFSPFSAGPAGAYEWWDAFYIPLYDFAGVRRPGPRVRIYALLPAEVSAHSSSR